MKAKTVPNGVETRDHRSGRDPARFDALALVEGLDRLQETINRRVDEIERIVVEQDQFYDLKPTERERLLREKISSLEASLARVHAENRRREQEWQAFLAQLEEDRRLLAEAWERLEREQIEVATATPERGAPTALAIDHPVAAKTSAPATPPPDARASPPALDASEDVVSRAILRQFQTMQGDVRRNAKDRQKR